MSSKREVSRRAARAAKKENQAVKVKAGFWDGISTDWLVGGMILGVVAVAAVVFFAGRFVRDNNAVPTVPFSQVLSLAAAPSGDALLVGDGSGLYRSKDSGKEWERIAFGSTPVRAIAADPRQSGALIAGAGSRVMRSNDGSKWDEIKTDLPSGAILGLASEQTGTMYAFVEGSGLFRTDDGAAWRSVAVLPGIELTSLAIKPGSPDIVFAFHSQRGLLRSTNGGVEFQAIAGGVLPVRSVSSLLTFADQPDTMMAVAQRSVYKSTDGGSTWAAANAGLRDAQAQVIALARDPRTGVLYASDMQGVIYSSPDAGQNWSKT